jgi:hypothetical protein
MQPYELKELAAEQAGDVETLVQLLEIEMDDILDRFFDKVVENKHKFGVEDENNS